MKLLNDIRSFITINFEPLKTKAFLEISEINGVLGADKSAYIPEDARSSNPHTIYDGNGRLVIGRVDPKDYFQGDDQFVGNVMSSIWFFLFTIVMSFVSLMGDSAITPNNIVNVGAPLGIFLLALLYVHKKTTQSVVMFIIWCAFELQLLAMANGPLASGGKGLFLNCLALSLPGVRLLFNNFLARKSRAHALYQNSRSNTNGLGAYAGLDLNYLKSLAKDKTPSYPVAPADGVFEHAGLVGALGQGQNIALSQKDGNRHMFIGGASGTGKSKSLQKHLQERIRINEQFKKNNPNFKESGMIVFCGKGDLPTDLGLIEDGGILHANITPFHYKVVNGVYKGVGVKRFPLLKGLTPEKYTLIVANANKTKGGGDNKIFEVTGESLTYRTAVTLFYLKKYGVKALGRSFKFSVKSNYQMLSELVKRQEIRTSNGAISFESNNHVLQDLIALVAYLKNEVNVLETNFKVENANVITQMKSEIEVLEATVQFVKNSLNEDIQKFIQSVVAQAQSWISCFMENSKLLDWADTDSDEADEFDILDVMRLRHTVNADGSITKEPKAEIKRYGITLKKEEFKEASKLAQNFIMERLFGAGSERGNIANWGNDEINYPFDLIIDEAQNVASQSLLEYTQEFRAWGISLIFMTQNLSALIARFDEKSILGFLASIANHVLFDPNDQYTLDYYQKRLGKIKNFTSSGDTVNPTDFRHTVKRVLQLPEFDRNNPYHEDFRRFRSGYNFGYKAKNNTVQKFMGYAVPFFFNFNAFQLFSTPETITVSKYKIDEREPVKDLFAPILHSELKTRGKALVLIDRGGKIRTDIATFYKLGDA